MNNPPPLFPGFIAASVWNKPSIVEPSCNVITLSFPEIYPDVKVDFKFIPSGLPIAIALSPIETCELSPNSTAFKSSPFGSIFNNC